MVCHNIPNFFNINPHIIVNKHIAKPGNISPWNIVSKLFGLFAYLFAGFTNDFEVPYYCILSFRVICKLPISSICVEIDFINSLFSI